MAAPLAIQLYTVRDQVAALGLDAVLDRIAAAGYVGVESAGFADRTPEQFATTLESRGLTHASAHGGLAADRDALAAQLDGFAATGTSTVVIPALGHDGFGDLDAIKRSADVVNGVAEQAQARGMQLGYHNHFWEMPAIDGRPALLHFFAAVNPSVFAEVDIYWAQVGGVDPSQLVRELGERARLLHVKDGPADTPKSDMTAVGDGKVDIRGVLASAPAAQWHIVELDRCATDMLEAVEGSARYLLGNQLSTGRA
jgi:sugar phosphate isomerase/epimerase